MNLKQAFKYISYFHTSTPKYDELEAVSCGLGDLGYSQDVVNQFIDPMAADLSVELLKAMDISNNTPLHIERDRLNAYQFLIFLICGIATDIAIVIKERSQSDLNLSEHWSEEFSLCVMNHFEANSESTLDKEPEEWAQLLFDHIQ